jgi:hypothetical protein
MNAQLLAAVADRLILLAAICAVTFLAYEDHLDGRSAAILGAVAAAHASAKAASSITAALQQRAPTLAPPARPDRVPPDASQLDVDGDPA